MVWEVFLQYIDMGLSQAKDSDAALSHIYGDGLTAVRARIELILVQYLNAVGRGKAP